MVGTPYIAEMWFHYGNSALCFCLHMYGIELPRSVAEERRIDQKNGNTFWVYEIQKEIDNVVMALTLLTSG